MSSIQPKLQDNAVGIQSHVSALPRKSHNEDETAAMNLHLSQEEGDGVHSVDQGPDSLNSVTSTKTSCLGSPPKDPLDAGITSSHISRHSCKLPLSPGQTTQQSPRTHSPASSLIFERDVQESVLPSQVSPSVPSHIRTENHIPSVLEASSAAIADDQLDPGSVEIVTHSMHQPAATGVASTVPTEQALSSSSTEEVALPPSESQELPTAYEALDTSRVRRLSFVSFADVINAEYVETSESLHNRDYSQATLNSGNPVPTMQRDRSPSPLRSPTSSHGFGSSPPTSISTSLIGLETSPNYGSRGAGSPFPMAQSPHSPKFGSDFGGDLNIETMQQALRKTGSGDLAGSRSQRSSTMGTIGNEDFFDCPM